jgi:putative hydrolase of the HAD superfamily
MAIKGILFDLYGTLIDSETDESLEEIYRGIAHYLTYHGVSLHRWEVRDLYYQIMKKQKEESGEEYPEIDVEAIWNAFLEQEAIKTAPARRDLARILAQLYRGISRKRLQLYPEVKRVMDELQPHYRMALVSDAQPCYALPEIKAVGLDGYFDANILKLTPPEVVYVGNDMYRDIYGASRLGVKTLFVDSNQGAKS